MHFRGVGKIIVWIGLLLMPVVPCAAQSHDSREQANICDTSEPAQEMLALHNAVRATVRLPPLQWSEMLAGYSQKWANVLLAQNLSSHNPNSPYGENIFITGSGATPSLVMKQWASEILYYSYITNSCSNDCGHYTQLVWRDTRKVGCAVARNERREIWVCSYDPPGNYRGEWPY